MAAVHPGIVMLREGEAMADESDVGIVEEWASSWLGGAWLAGPGDDGVEAMLEFIVRRATDFPSPAGLATVAAIRRLAPGRHADLLDAALSELAEQPHPSWLDAPPRNWLRASRAEGYWGSAELWFMAYPETETLLIEIDATYRRSVIGFAMLDDEGMAGVVSKFGEAGFDFHPMTEVPRDEALTIIASALDSTESVPLSADDENSQVYADHRALAWAQCHAHLTPYVDSPEDPPAEHQLAEDFLAAHPGANPVLVRLLSQFSHQVLREPTIWSPSTIWALINIQLPQWYLFTGELAAFPSVLEAWTRFMLARRGAPASAVQASVAELEDQFPPALEYIAEKRSHLPEDLVRELMNKSPDPDDRESLLGYATRLDPEEILRDRDDGEKV